MFPNGLSQQEYSPTEHTLTPSSSSPLFVLYTRIFSTAACDVELEYKAFAKMLQQRTTTENGVVLFRLFKGLTLSPPVPELVVEKGDVKYLWIDCLSD